MSHDTCPVQFVRRIGQLLADKGAWDGLSEFDVRHNYVLELLRHLGWNVENRGLSPFDFEVLCEAFIRSGRPDITLRLNGSSVFYVETKSLRRVLSDDDVMQVWRYAWTSGHPFSLLTNFLESWLIDCRSTPPGKALGTNCQRQVIMRWHAANLEKQWDSIHSLLGRRAVAEGSLTELEESISQRAPKIRGVELTLFPLQGAFPVDRYFLGQLDEWRLRLVKNIHASQTKWTSDQVVEVSDQLLNLIVFTRILEDQGLEPDYPLKRALEKATGKSGVLMRSINHLRADLDEKYNGTVFKPFPESLAIDEQVLSDIIASIYPPDSPYLLDFLPAEILGTIYERFLGSGVEFSSKGTLRLADERESRKEGGVFYTERYVTNFMVRSVLEPMLTRAKPEDVFGFRIADIACGSGSFLISAFRNLVFWLEQKCLQKDAWREAYLERRKDGAWRLRLQTKLDILKNCFYGVDIDREAVSVTKFSLYLQALAGETEDSIRTLWNLRRRPILPILDRNIQCGNTLVRQEIVDDLLDGAGQKQKINPFDLEESFSEVFAEKGFSVILGNPPYNATLSKAVKEYCKRYTLSPGNFNTANLFIERTYELLRKGGSWCLIVPKSLIYSDKWVATRNYLRKHLSIAVDASKAFKDVRLEQVIVGHVSGRTRLTTGSLTPTKQSCFGGMRSLPFTDILPVNIAKAESLIGQVMANHSEPMDKWFTLRRGVVPLSSLRETGEVKVLQGRFIQGYTIVSPDRGISPGQAADILERTPDMELPKIVAQQIVSHSLKPLPHVRFVGMVDFWRLLSVDTVSNIIPRSLPRGEKERRLFMLLALGVFNARATSWFADRFIYAKAIRTMHLDNCHLAKMRFPLAASWDGDVAKKVAGLVEQRIGLRVQDAPSGRETYVRDCKSLEDLIDRKVAQLFGLSSSQQDEINAVFGDECLGDMGLAGRSDGLLNVPIPTKKHDPKQLRLWED